MADKPIKGWITKGGKHIPIYEKDAQIADAKKKADAFNLNKKAEDLLVKTKQFKYTHDELKKMFSRAQIYPAVNHSTEYIKQLDKLITQVDSNSDLYKELNNERHRLFLLQRDLLVPHMERIHSEIDGHRVYMNDDHYHKLGY